MGLRALLIVPFIYTLFCCPSKMQSWETEPALMNNDSASGSTESSGGVSDTSGTEKSGPAGSNSTAEAQATKTFDPGDAFGGT